MTTDQYDPEYDCGVCGDNFSAVDGVLACEIHFYCNKCAIEVFHRSLINKNEFPASCCARSRNGLPPVLFEDLLGPEFMDRYKLKLHEYYTPEAIRVYCANAHCALYKSPKEFDNSDQRRPIAHCECGTDTCVGCRNKWLPEHMCPRTSPATKPAWVPTYSSSCRVKQCPKCQEWIELFEACNHMTCSSCHHDFCFICLLPFTGFHEREGCPAYGDRLEGYDNEGFELTDRGLHIHTGRDREGYDRLGLDVHGQPRTPLPTASAESRAELERYQALFRRHLQEEPADIARRQQENEEALAAYALWQQQLEALDAGPLPVAGPVPLLVEVAEHIEDINEDPYHGIATFDQIHPEDLANFIARGEEYDRMQEERDPFLDLFAEDEHHQEQAERMEQAMEEAEDRQLEEVGHQTIEQLQALQGVHAVLADIANTQVEPDRNDGVQVNNAPNTDLVAHPVAGRRAAPLHWDPEIYEWGVKEMIEAAEQELAQLQPFYDPNFGISFMFDQKEEEMYEQESQSCVVEGLASSGAFQMTLPVHQNLYEVLGQDDGPGV
jgi:hypothetical protein